MSCFTAYVSDRIKKRSSQCNLIAQLEPVQDKKNINMLSETGMVSKHVIS